MLASATLERLQDSSKLWGRAACNSSADPSRCVFFAEKPAGQRSSPSSRTSPGTALQEVSLAEMVSSLRGVRGSLVPTTVVI